MLTNDLYLDLHLDLDLDAYFERIGFAGDRSPTLSTLRELHWRHPLAIPFENIDPFLRRHVRLDIGSIQKKLVTDRRGGWCYEHNILFQHVLRALGFDVTGFAARSLWELPEGARRARSHMLLRIELEGTPYVADVGFGGITLTGPLLLEANAPQTTPHEPFRLIALKDDDDGGGFAMEVEAGGKWRPLYRFDMQPQHLIDYEVWNWYLCTNPESHFLRGIMAARPTPTGRYALSNNKLSIHHLNGPSERKVLTTAAELRTALTGLFGITLPDSPDLELVLERLAAERPGA